MQGINVTIVTSTFVPYTGGEAPEWVKYELNEALLKRIIAEKNRVKDRNLNAVELSLGMKLTWPTGTDMVYEAQRIDARGFAHCAVVNGGELYVESMELSTETIICLLGHSNGDTTELPEGFMFSEGIYFGDDTDPQEVQQGYQDSNRAS